MSEKPEKPAEDENTGTAHPVEESEIDQSQENPVEVISESDDKFAQLEKEHLYLRAEMENMKRQNIKERSQV